MVTSRKNNLFFILICISLLLLNFFFETYLTEQRKFYMLSNNLYTDNHATFIINGDYRWLNETFTESEYRLFLEYDHTYRLFLRDAGEWRPPIVSGDFFIYDEIKLQAVVGQEMTNLIYEDNGNKYILYQGKEFEVKGMMGASFPTSTDYLVLLYQPNYLPPESGLKLVLDSDEQSVVERVTEEIISHGSAVKIISSQKGLLRTGNILSLFNLIIFEFYTLLMISIVVFMRYWYEQVKRVTFVLYLLGIPKISANKQIFYRVIINVFMAGAGFGILLFILGSEPAAMAKQFVAGLIFSSVAVLSVSMFLWLDYISSKRGVN